VRYAPPNGHEYRGFHAKAGLLTLNQFGITFTARLPTTITTAPSCKIQIAAKSGRGGLVPPPDDIIKRTMQIAQGLGDQHFRRSRFQSDCSGQQRIDPTWRG
jgi:hypothetical protein